MLTSCGSDREYSEDIKPAPGEIVPASPVINASFDDDTRASLDNNDITWDANDKIMVFLKRLTPDEYVLSKGADTDKGLFQPQGKVEAHLAEIPHFVAVYPSSNDLKLEKAETRYTMTGMSLPSEQKYKPNSVDYTTAPMLAVSEQTNIKFKNLTGLLKLSLKDPNNVVKIKKIIVKDRQEGNISGQFKLIIDNPEQYSMEFTDNNSKQTVLNCNEAVLLSDVPTDFYIMLLPKVYGNGLTIELYNENNKLIKGVNTKSIEIERTTIKSMPVLDVNNFVVDAATHTISVYKPGCITEDMIKTAVDGTKELKIKGYVNGADMKAIREATGCTYYGGVDVDKVLVNSLDLTDANIVRSEDVYKITNGQFNKIDEDNVIGDFMFYFSPLENIKLPKNLKKIGEKAFQGCCLKKIVFPKSLEFIKSYSFYQSSLASVEFKGNVGIAEEVLAKCYNLYLVKFSDKQKNIGRLMFNKCSTLKQITLPNSITIINDNAFMDSGLESLTIPQSVEQIGENILGPNITSLRYECDLSKVHSDGNFGTGDFTNNGKCNLYIRKENISYIKTDAHDNPTFAGKAWRSIRDLDGNLLKSSDQNTGLGEITDEDAY